MKGDDITLSHHLIQRDKAFCPLLPLTRWIVQEYLHSKGTGCISHLAAHIAYPDNTESLAFK